MYPPKFSDDLPDSVIFKFGVRPYGMTVLQSWLQIAAIMDAIEVYGINTFIEIGVAEGGLGSLISQRSNYVNGFKYIGIEIDQKAVNKEFKFQCTFSGKTLVFGNVFSPKVSGFLKMVMDLAKGPTLLFCDGGDKVKEIQTFHSFLRAGDFLMVHDYMPGLEQAAGGVVDSDLKFLVEHPDFIEIYPYRQAYRLPLFKRVN
jgi:cephalosporin hydroxylase